MPRMTLLPDGVSGEMSSGTSLLRGAATLGVELFQFCGGIAACTTCRVLIQQGKENLSPIELAEQEVLSEAGIVQSHRLACQARILGDVVIERPVWTPLKAADQN